MSNTKEVAIIDFTKFDIAQLPELKGKKKEITAVIKANPVVEVTDNASYELAKKSRTAVRTLRTSLQEEQKNVKKRIKEFVLDVVENEYDSLIESVKTDENARQKPVTDWEEKKEQERLEKARLEQERIDSIKTKIKEFRDYWENIFITLSFLDIENIREDYSVAVVEFDRDALAEFDVLFTDAVNYIDKLLESRIKTLEEQEQIRIDQAKLKIQNDIADWFRIWNTRIIKVETSAICQELFKGFNDEKPLNCGEFQSEFGEKRSQLVSTFETRIEMLKNHENQQIAQEKFLAEKRDFEEKQAEAKYQERIKQLTDLGIDIAVFELEHKGDPRWMNLKTSAKIESDSDWNETILWVKMQISKRNEVQINHNSAEEPISIEDAFKDFKSANNQDAPTNTQEVEFKENWGGIELLYLDSTSNLNVFEWLSENYNVPTPKN